MSSGWEYPFIFLAIGLALAAYGWLLLLEYRKLFLEDPKAVMTLEVIMHLFRYGSGPGYLAMFIFLAAAFFIILSLYEGSEYFGRLLSWLIRAEWSGPKT